MKLSQLIMSYASQPYLRASLNKQISFTEDGKSRRMAKDTISDVLIDMGNGKYHFEAKNTAIVVNESEITFL